MNIGLYIKQLRTEKDKTLHQVAVGTDIDATLLSKIERGDRLPTDAQISKIALFFQVPINNLQVLSIARKIIKDYGLNEITMEAIQLVKKEFKSSKTLSND